MPFFDDIAKSAEWQRMIDTVSPRVMRIWFVLDSQNPYGPNNIGVSARSVRRATELIEARASSLSQRLPYTCLARVILDVDLSRLDPVNVAPHVGDSGREGIWWPSLVAPRA